MCEYLYANHNAVSHDDGCTVIGNNLRVLENLILLSTKLFARLHIKGSNEAERSLILHLKVTMHLMQITYQMTRLINYFYPLRSESL